MGVGLIKLLDGMCHKYSEQVNFDVVLGVYDTANHLIMVKSTHGAILL